jgi:hypothetical protein
MKHLWLFLISIIAISCQQSSYQYQEGDLFFQDLDSSPLCEAIELVTPGYQGSNFSHIGLLVQIKGEWRILEALPPKVSTTTIDSFLNRSFDEKGNPKVLVGRIKTWNEEERSTVCQAAIQQIGMPYDDTFIKGNGQWYCSELIQEAYHKIDSTLFPSAPMTFLNPNSQDTLTIWKDYYQELNTAIPEGEAGINPGLMSIAPTVQMVHLYGKPDGYQAQ